MEFNETWLVARSQSPLPSLCFSGRSEKRDGCPGLWFADTLLPSPLKPLNRIQRNLTGSRISMSSPMFVFFGLIGKTRWLPWPLICWYIIAFSSETTSQNSKKLETRSQRPLPSLCLSDWFEKQDGCPSLWFDETLLTCPLKPLSGIQWKFTGSKISTSYTNLTKFLTSWDECLGS